MRVTNQIITRNSQARLQSGLQGIDRVREDISSGIRVRKMSDDPTSAGEVVRVGSSMRAIAMFRRNIDIGLSRAATEETALNQLGDGLTRGIELGIAQASGTSTAQTRLIAKTEVDQLIGFAVGLGNTKFGDDYVFGGTRSTEQPLRVPPSAGASFSNLMLGASAVDPSGAISLEVGDNKFVTPNHNASDIFLTSDALESLRALSTALGSNDVPGIQAATGRLNAADSVVQNMLGTQGARINEMESARTNLDGLELTLKAFRSDLRDTEVDKAMAELVGKQTMYQAAMSATSRILGLSLANYL